MKFIFLTCFIGVCMLCTAQVKKKDQGFYKGVIPGYSINTGQELIKVDSCELYIKIEKTRITIRIDDKEYQGLYKVDKREKRNYLIKAETDYSDIKEEIILFGKDKTMKRKGLFPQPDVFLIKLKKKEALW